jgi:hypothetical protein
VSGAICPGQIKRIDMRSIPLLLAVAAATMIAGAATAQTPGGDTMGGAAPPADTSAPSDMRSGPPARDRTQPLGSEANPIPQSSPTPPEEASRLKAGDPTVVTNGPIPDTPENRARFGGPKSHAGRRTKPAGN